MFRPMSAVGGKITSGVVACVAVAAAMTVAATGLGDTPAFRWKATTQSPRPGALDASLTVVGAACGTADVALSEVAARTARRQADGASLLAADELGFTLHAGGEPHVWPRAWSVAGPTLDPADLAHRVKLWVSPWNTLGIRRCGVARAAVADGSSVVAVVAVDALADLAPLPTTARVGQWLTLDGTMLVPASAAKVVLLGPRGAPKTVLASLSGDRIHSTFSVDQPGGWMIQVLATVSTGPRPVLEARVYAGVLPPDQFVSTQAPGESAAQGAADDNDGMFRMINAARASELRTALARDATLDKLAKVHSEEMLKVRTVGHDVGTGDPSVRLRAAGVLARVAGENVATARTLERAHRALWASPSHRGNLLLDEFTRVGVAAVRAPDGMVWVTELFSG